MSILLNYTTAYGLLTRAVRLKPGDTALVHGAAGGVGTATLQLARLLGIRMYGTVSAGKMALVEQLGGIPIDYRRSDFVAALQAMEPGGVRAVFDPIGGRQLARSYRVLGRDGTLVLFGASSTLQGAGNPNLALAATAARFLLLKMQPGSRRAVTYSIDQVKRRRPEQFRQDVQHLLTLLQEGKIKPQVGRVLPLSEVRQAHALLEGAKVTGKIVLQP